MESYDILEQAWITLQLLEPLEMLAKLAVCSAASTIQKLIVPPGQTIPYDLSKLTLFTKTEFSIPSKTTDLVVTKEQLLPAKRGRPSIMSLL